MSAESVADRHSRALLTGYFLGLGAIMAVWGARMPAVQQAAHCEPDPAVYQHAMNATGTADPHRVLFVDDRADNCHAAGRLGLRTLHYTGRPADLAAALQSPN
ncbi:hypothetical protein E7X58_28115 [Streptomyces sp. A1499]|nr:hypothetical protein E7X58_28115 [Streptomyces sp. A1499]